MCVSIRLLLLASYWSLPVATAHTQPTAVPAVSSVWYSEIGEKCRRMGDPLLLGTRPSSAGSGQGARASTMVGGGRWISPCSWIGQITTTA